MNQHLNEEQLVGYIHYALTDAERETMDEHLKGCVDCRARLDDDQALQRRIRYELSSEIKAATPPPSMTFVAVAPLLQRRRWWEQLQLPSGQFLPDATALAALAGLVVALLGLFQSLGWSSGDATTISRNPLSILSCGCFGIAVMGNYSRRTWPTRVVVSRALAFVLWIGTAIVGLQVIAILLDILMWLSLRGLPANLTILSIWPIGIAWIAVVVGGGEYHYRHMGQRSSWRLFGWTIGLELLILLSPILLEALFDFARLLS